MASTLAMLVTAVAPVLQAGILAAVGAALAAFGTLDARGTSVVAALCFYLYTPALSFTTISSTITLDSIRHLWALFANMVVSMVVGLGAGFACAAACRAPPEFRNLIATCVAFGNVGNLPLVFVRALCTDRGSVFWRTSGPADHCERLGVAYTAIDICAATLFQFSIAVQMLRPKPAPVQLDPEARRAASLDCAVGPAAGSLPRLEKTPTCSDLLAHADSSAGRSSPRAFRGSAPGLSLDGVQMTELQQGRRPPGGPRSLPGALEQEQLLPTTVQQGQHEFWVPRGRSWRERLRGAWRWLRGVDVAAAFPIPTQAAVAGVVVGCTPWLKGLLYRDDGSGPPLRVVTEALNLLAGGLIPGAIPLLGAVLWRGPGASRLPWRVVLSVMCTRLVLQPVLLTGGVVAALQLGLYRPPDAMFLLTLLLANATPTAINLQTMTVLYDHGAEEMSQLLFWQYLASLLTLPAFMWLFLHIIDAFMVV